MGALTKTSPQSPHFPLLLTGLCGRDEVLARQRVVLQHVGESAISRAAALRVMTVQLLGRLRLRVSDVEETVVFGRRRECTLV